MMQGTFDFMASYVKSRAVELESESDGILVESESVKMYRLWPCYTILNMYWLK
jgi:hypothetical protein